MQTPERAAPLYPIEGIDRALRVLLLFKDRRELTLSEVREHLDVGHSTAHRLMAMLLYRGFAVQDDRTRAYRAGPELFNIASAVADTFDLRTAARPVLEQLARQTGETVHLGTLQGPEVLYVDCVESPALLRVSGRVGKLTPAYASSLGKAMLSTLTDESVLSLYPAQLEQLTERTLGSRAALLESLRQVRGAGFARNREEVELGVASVAVAVLPSSRSSVAALSVAAPLSRTSPERTDDHVALLRLASERLAASI
ncbi:IclR family transcriptional regulator [Georgenia sp. EYE_87]|uniref:IclR family transcriptional regulator n=1 Tax=Georgenia sp. EYE_87 TaxID=2853448 RepID=UPI0020052158|nr:IclR family transcriptional regulator [Georgenia sp. EYE_87]MCK6210773.1 IclR family transcriptional regulator [Georgenia sp. EYE_87]